jgi:phosphoglycerate dehydrogenase-like enzyme
MRIYILNDPDAPAPMSLGVSRLRSAMEKAGVDMQSVSLQEGSNVDGVEDADILFSCRKVDIAKLKAHMPSLAWVQVISAGVEQMLPTLPDDIMLTNASGVHGEKGGEFVLTAALMLNYRIPTFVSDKDQRRWQPEFVTPAHGKRVTLLGVGGIGKSAVSALRGRCFTITGVTRSGRCDAAVDAAISMDMIDSILPDTDILVSTLPLTPQTRNLIDRNRLKQLPAHAGVIIVGRAAVFDYEAMADMLAAGELGGAVLDVFPVEPLPADSRLWSCPNLIMTPHCSVDDHATYMDSCLDIFVDNFARRMRGEPLRNLIDRALGY